jgi:hypothetical protein
MHSNDPYNPQCGVEHTYIEAPVIKDTDSTPFDEAVKELYESTGIEVKPSELTYYARGYLEDFIAELATNGATNLSIINQCFLEAFKGGELALQDEEPSVYRLWDACANRAIADNWPCPSTQAEHAQLLQEARKNDG